MNKSDRNSIFPYFYCHDCDIDIEKNDTEKFLEHKEHNIVEIKKGDPDPSLLRDFQKKGLSIKRKIQKPKKEKNAVNKDERNEAKKLFDFALSKIKRLVISENNQNEVYAIIENNSHIETLHLSTSRARYWLNVLYSNEVNTKEIRSEDFYKGVLYHIISKAQMNGTSRSKVYNRVAQLDGEIYYDLGTPNWEAVRISKSGIKIMKLDVDSPIFRRSQTLYEQVKPEFVENRALDNLCDLLRIVGNDRLVFKVHLVTMFLEEFPIPIMIFDGSAGSLKTTATTSVKRVIDPNGKSKEDNAGTMSTKNDDLVIQLSNRYLASFDNVSKIDQQSSDTLCRAITGSSNQKRELYTNADEIILNMRRKIVLNGIVPTLDYPDLRERALFYTRETIDETNRISEEEFEKRFQKILPSVLGECLTHIHRAMKISEPTKNEVKPRSRMADFEIWGESIASSMGYQKNQFLESYYEKLSEGTLNAKDHYPIVDIIQNFMDNKIEMDSTMSSLFKTIKAEAENDGIEINSKYVHFPKTPNQLSRDLKIVNPILSNLGYLVEIDHYTKRDGKYPRNASIVRIRRRNKQSTLDGSSYSQKPTDSSISTINEIPSMSSLSPCQDRKQTQNDDKNGKDVADEPLSDPCQKIPENKHEIESGKDDKDGYDNFITISNHTHFTCETCNAGPFNLEASTKSSGSILDFHRKAGHVIKFMTESEVEQYLKKHQKD